MKFIIISNINIKHEIEARNEDEALEIRTNEIKLPKEYISNSWKLVKITEKDKSFFQKLQDFMEEENFRLTDQTENGKDIFTRKPYDQIKIDIYIEDQLIN